MGPPHFCTAIYMSGHDIFELLFRPIPHSLIENSPPFHITDVLFYDPYDFMTYEQNGIIIVESANCVYRTKHGPIK